MSNAVRVAADDTAALHSDAPLQAAQIIGFCEARALALPTEMLEVQGDPVSVVARIGETLPAFAEMQGAQYDALLSELTGKVAEFTSAMRSGFMTCRVSYRDTLDHLSETMRDGETRQWLAYYKDESGRGACVDSGVLGARSKDYVMYGSARKTDDVALFTQMTLQAKKQAGAGQILLFELEAKGSRDNRVDDIDMLHDAMKPLLQHMAANPETIRQLAQQIAALQQNPNALKPPAAAEQAPDAKAGAVKAGAAKAATPVAAAPNTIVGQQPAAPVKSALAAGPAAASLTAPVLGKTPALTMMPPIVAHALLTLSRTSIMPQALVQSLLTVQQTLAPLLAPQAVSAAPVARSAAEPVSPARNFQLGVQLAASAATPAGAAQSAPAPAVAQSLTAPTFTVAPMPQNFVQTAMPAQNISAAPASGAFVRNFVQTGLQQNIAFSMTMPRVFLQPPVAAQPVADAPIRDTLRVMDSAPAATGKSGVSFIAVAMMTAALMVDQPAVAMTLPAQPPIAATSISAPVADGAKPAAIITLTDAAAPAAPQAQAPVAAAPIAAQATLVHNVQPAAVAPQASQQAPQPLQPAQGNDVAQAPVKAEIQAQDIAKAPEAAPQTRVGEPPVKTVEQAQPEVVVPPRHQSDATRAHDKIEAAPDKALERSRERIAEKPMDAPSAREKQHAAVKTADAETVRPATRQAYEPQKPPVSGMRAVFQERVHSFTNTTGNVISLLSNTLKKIFGTGCNGNCGACGKCFAQAAKPSIENNPFMKGMKETPAQFQARHRAPKAA